MRIILMLRRILSLLLICTLAFQAAGAAAAGAVAALGSQSCHATAGDGAPVPSGHAAVDDCTVHCLSALALPASLAPVFDSPSRAYERTAAPPTLTRFDAPPNPPPIR